MTERSMGSDATLMPGSGGAVDGRTLQPGQTVGHYRIVRLLGRGGMGEVHLAEHTELQTSHALKTILPQWAGQPGFQRRFQAEARLMAHLRHPHIVRCTDSGTEQGVNYLVMDYIDGPRGDPMDLRALLAERRKKGEFLDEEEAAAVGLQICEALSYAHEFRAEGIPAGIIHRDLKPANILVDRSTHLLVTDFGLARLIGEGFESKVIEQSMMSMRSMGEARTLAEGRQTSSDSVGTFDYMSPEQREGGTADCRSDVYAMGAILYELLTGRKVAGVPARPSRVRPGLNKAWDDIIHERCLAYDPADRFDNAQQLMAAVQEVLTKRHAPVSPPEPPPPTPAVRPSTASADRSLSIDLGSGVKMEMVWIPPGEFMMGSSETEEGRSSDEWPQHRVTLTKGFWMGKCAVTQDQWEQVMGTNPSHFKKEKLLGLFGGKTVPGYPVERVSWNACQKFMEKLNQRTEGGGQRSEFGGLRVRLPTEAEWEYACRAGTTTRFNVGNGDADLDRAGWYFANSGSTTHPVGQKTANAWGLYDMHGNVWEWCQDWYGNYDSGAVTDPTGPSSGSSRVVRGGSWSHGADCCRVAFRSGDSPGYACDYSYLGFRAALPTGPAAAP